MKLVLAAAIVALCSCTATYDSPHTGIKYRVEVPLSALERYLEVAPQK